MLEADGMYQRVGCTPRLYRTCHVLCCAACAVLCMLCRPVPCCSTALLLPALKPREPEVYAYAVSYIRVRSFGIVAAMLGFVASGSYRGIKDTATPLKAAMGAAATHLVLTPLFILGECVCMCM